MHAQWDTQSRSPSAPAAPPVMSSLVTSSPMPHPGAWGPSDRVQDYAIAASHSTLYSRTWVEGADLGLLPG